MKKVEGAYTLKFDMTALQFGLLANAFAAFKGSENKKLMTDKDIKARYGGVGNQYAVTEILAFLISLPVMFYTEGDMWPKFLELLKTSKELQFNLAMSGLAFYLQRARDDDDQDDGRGHRALTDEQKIGAGVAIGGVLIYSVIDDLLAPKKKAA
ncbi:hypothetical protein JL722_4883 [Aureococcus anophagefferens]|nr:hypothetical protein JL722_4883 [Aureococcus anophagefferens]